MLAQYRMWCLLQAVHALHVASTLFYLSAATQRQRCHVVGGGGATLKDTQGKIGLQPAVQEFT